MKAEYVELAKIELENLARAAIALGQPTAPPTSLPRPRIFHFGQYHWPLVRSDGEVVFNMIVRTDSRSGRAKYMRIYNDYNYSVDEHIGVYAYNIVGDAGCEPRYVMRALNTLRAATAWCYARLEGRQKAADDIRKQASRVLDALDAEVALLTLGKR